MNVKSVIDKFFLDALDAVETSTRLDRAELELSLGSVIDLRAQAILWIVLHADYPHLGSSILLVVRERVDSISTSLGNHGSKRAKRVDHLLLFLLRQVLIADILLAVVNADKASRSNR